MRVNINKMKTRKRQMRLTYEDLSKRSGVPKRTIEDIFAERTVSPRIDTISAIEQALELNESPTTNKDDELYNVIQSLSESEKNEVSNFIDFVISKRGKQE